MRVQWNIWRALATDVCASWGG